jgi:hypothetical protein
MTDACQENRHENWLTLQPWVLGSGAGLVVGGVQRWGDFIHPASEESNIQVKYDNPMLRFVIPKLL